MYAHPRLRRPLPASRARRSGVLAVIAGLVLSLLALVPQTPASAAPSLLSQGKAVTSSSQENDGTPASAAVDGNNGTRWSSAFSDPQWIKIDLGAAASVSQIVLRWEAAYSTAYRIEFSSDNSSWSTAYSTTTGPGGTETLNVSGTARYVRLTGTARATGYGHSLWEFQVFGTTGGSDPQIPGGGDLGPNVLVFDPSTPGIQAKVDAIFKQQESAQFGTGRYALMFKPGTYNNINAQIGFYT
ncbi:discoidin domain-containing protein, partial [Streptomyces sp. NPDC001822]|uniref:discoidin domain-containing protein n=1 Tax=Streptomyces sp. NPDC001822 TaxID=3364614 RepID=UPI0036AF5418